jgi:hypothetical protein
VIPFLELLGNFLVGLSLVTLALAVVRARYRIRQLESENLFLRNISTQQSQQLNKMGNMLVGAVLSTLKSQGPSKKPSPSSPKDSLN